MGLVSRITNMFKAHAHSKLDDIEDTSELISHQIRESNESILSAMHDVAQVRASCQLLQEKRDHASTKSLEYERKAYLLLESANKGVMSEQVASNLAIEALNLKESYDKQYSDFDTMHRKQSEVARALEERIHSGKASISEYKNKLFSLKARMKTAKMTQKITRQIDGFEANSLESLVERMNEKVVTEEAFANSSMLLSSDHTEIDERINNALKQTASIEVHNKLLEMKRKLK